SVSTPQESKVVKNDKVIAPGMFRINPFKNSREEKHLPNTVRASARTKPITVSQPHVITKKDVNSDSNGLSSTGIDNTKTRRPQPRSNTKNDRVPSASKSSRSKNKGAEVDEHHRNLPLSKNTKHMSSACNNIKLDSQNVIFKVVCAMCKQCLIFVNHDQSAEDRKNLDGKKKEEEEHLRWLSHRYPTDVAMRIRDEDTDEIRASPSNEKGNSNNLTVVLGTSGCLNVDVTLLKNQRWLCGSCLP
nr:hypothetical protein [Tanacetum cinerariifolium]